MGRPEARPRWRTSPSCQKLQWTVQPFGLRFSCTSIFGKLLGIRSDAHPCEPRCPLHETKAAARAQGMPLAANTNRIGRTWCRGVGRPTRGRFHANCRRPRFVRRGLLAGRNRRVFRLGPTLGLLGRVWLVEGRRSSPSVLSYLRSRRPRLSLPFCVTGGISFNASLVVRIEPVGRSQARRSEVACGIGRDRSGCPPRGSGFQELPSCDRS
jgi:hypothetical protein